ncbi:hypothetical protein C2E20_0535 [Micractinium conductrix]|uniref:Uncharacterized protein n=1 Tax=Micractinium conductrix TaxID=554055 RepID=A0A2P6VS61_9CHLO|nr:hypothetical protein C2E20_0535 [Micractinium conductrix]|eukprot:PSC76922.1 hypothetical protein C2E20_0535 [Micractinium conductrix]
MTIEAMLEKHARRSPASAGAPPPRAGTGSPKMQEACMLTDGEPPRVGVPPPTDEHEWAAQLRAMWERVRVKDQTSWEEQRERHRRRFEGQQEAHWRAWKEWVAVRDLQQHMWHKWAKELEGRQGDAEEEQHHHQQQQQQQQQEQQQQQQEQQEQEDEEQQEQQQLLLQQACQEQQEGARERQQLQLLQQRRQHNATWQQPDQQQHGDGHWQLPPLAKRHRSDTLPVSPSPLPSFLGMPSVEATAAAAAAAAGSPLSRRADALLQEIMTGAFTSLPRRISHDLAGSSTCNPGRSTAARGVGGYAAAALLRRLDPLPLVPQLTGTLQHMQHVPSAPPPPPPLPEPLPLPDLPVGCWPPLPLPLPCPEGADVDGQAWWSNHHHQHHQQQQRPAAPPFMPCPDRDA